MGYMQDVRQTLEKRLSALEQVWQDGDVEQCDAEREAFIKFAMDKVLESYKNGLNGATLRVDKAERTLKQSKFAPRKR